MRKYEILHGTSGIEISVPMSPVEDELSETILEFISARILHFY